jgi:hypothetical protein|tara:strand:+ start:2717 stop:2863 length:147 start_codon:yes stop_codon:yes gene_type:complete
MTLTSVQNINQQMKLNNNQALKYRMLLLEESKQQVVSFGDINKSYYIK